MVTFASTVTIGSNTWLKGITGKLVASFFASAFLLAYRWWPDLGFNSSLIFLACGFIYPGMAHGSLDFIVMKRFRGGSGSDALSISIYLLLIAAVLVSWMIVPALTFILFLINSAYHFGETDLRNTEGRFARAIQLMYGAALLGFFFFSHGEEAGRYLAYFGLNLTVSGTVGAFFTSLFLFLVSAGLLFIFGRKAVVADVLIVALIGTQLPLVLAFGLYYILIHSRSAWSDLGRELSLDTTRMIRLSMPFIAGGCALMGIAYWVIGTTHAVSEHPIVLLIAGLAAITLPHSLAMALMYRSTKGSRS